MRTQAPKSEKSTTEKFLLCLTTELKKKIKNEAHKKFGNRKGAESMYVEMMLRVSLGMNVEGVAET